MNVYKSVKHFQNKTHTWLKREIKLPPYITKGRLGEECQYYKQGQGEVKSIGGEGAYGALPLGTT